MPVILTVAGGQMCCRQNYIVRVLRDYYGRSIVKLRQDFPQLIAIEHSSECALRFVLNISDFMRRRFEQSISDQRAKYLILTISRRQSAARASRWLCIWKRGPRSMP